MKTTETHPCMSEKGISTSTFVGKVDLREYEFLRGVK
jgi:hypothetical protein